MSAVGVTAVLRPPVPHVCPDLNLSNWPALGPHQGSVDLAEWRLLYGAQWWQAAAWYAQRGVVSRADALEGSHRRLMRARQCHVLNATAYCFCERQS
jgi:hypothetical protein